MESRRQQQVAGVIQQEIGDILQKNGRNYYGSSFVTISGVKVTPDLLVARIFVSVFVKNERKAVIEALKNNASHIRGQLGNKVKNQFTIFCLSILTFKFVSYILVGKSWKVFNWKK
jgi:ribosome-binding factor A